MNIYVSHSREFDFKNELYLPLRDSSVFKDDNLILPHESKEFINTKELFKQGKCDLVVAEVSYPSTGQGMELAWANDLNLKIVCFFKTGSKVTSAIKLITSDVIEYSSTEDLIAKISKFIK